MCDYQAFKSRKAAQAELAKLAGWDAKIALVKWEDHPLASARGYVFVIECNRRGNECKYLREDGFVR